MTVFLLLPLYHTDQGPYGKTEMACFIICARGFLDHVGNMHSKYSASLIIPVYIVSTPPSPELMTQQRRQRLMLRVPRGIHSGRSLVGHAATEALHPALPSPETVSL